MKHIAGFAAIMLVVNLLIMNHSVTFWDEDEAAYAGFAIEMLNSGDWINPKYEWSTIHRKTPFHFWTIAVSYKIFGINEFATRLPSVLAILLTCLSVFLMGKKLLGEKAALQAAIILATSIQLPLMGKISLTDATLLLFQTTSVLALLNYLYQPSWKWNLLLWLSIALGILTKGPPIILLVGGLWFLLAIFHPLRKNLIGTHPWFFGILSLLPFAYWCYLSYNQDYITWQESKSAIPFEIWWQEELNGKKIHLLPFLWDWYVLKRVGGSVLGQSGFPGYHFIVLTVAFLTWLPFWFITIGAVFKSFKKPSDLQLSLLLWVVMGWFFWELMSSKLPSYSLAAQPVLAIFMAMEIEKIQNNSSILNTWFKIGFGLFFFIFSILIIGLPIAGNILLGNWTLYYLLPMSIILLGILVRIFQQKNNPEKLVQNLTIHGAIFMFLIWFCISPIIEKSAVKSFDEVLESASTVSKNNRQTRLILTGLDIKQQKISLLVYAQKHFDKYEMLDLPEAMTAFQSKTPTVLVIGEEKIEGFRQAFANAKIPFNAKKILYRSTDDALREHDFWVIGNIYN